MERFFYQVPEDEGLAKIGKGANLYGAPLVVIVCADHGKAWVRPFDKKQTTDIDASILTDHMMLQATELGLGSVWICYFKPDVIPREFGLPEKQGDTVLVFITGIKDYVFDAFDLYAFQYLLKPIEIYAVLTLFQGYCLQYFLGSFLETRMKGRWNGLYAVVILLNAVDNAIEACRKLKAKEPVTDAFIRISSLQKGCSS